MTVKTKELNDWIKTCSDEEKNLRAIFESRYYINIIFFIEYIKQKLLIKYSFYLIKELHKN